MIRLSLLLLHVIVWLVPSTTLFDSFSDPLCNIYNTVLTCLLLTIIVVLFFFRFCSWLVHLLKLLACCWRLYWLLWLKMVSLLLPVVALIVDALVCTTSSTFDTQKKSFFLLLLLLNCTIILFTSTTCSTTTILFTVGEGACGNAMQRLRCRVSSSETNTIPWNSFYKTIWSLCSLTHKSVQFVAVVSS